MSDADKKQWGGARSGSGPKPLPEYGAYLTERIDVRLTKEQHQHILAQAEAQNISAAEYLRRLIEADMSRPPA